MRHVTVRAMTGVFLVLVIGLAPLRVAFAEDTGSGGGSSGGDQATSLAQAVQQIAQQVQQVVQAVQQLATFATSIFSRTAGSVFGPGGTPWFAGGGPSGGGSAMAPWLAQLQQLMGALSQAQSAVWTEFGSEWGQAPDYTYSTGTIAAELQQIASQLPGRVGQWVAQLAQRLASATAPAPRTPQWDATQIAGTDATFAARAHAVQQAQVATTAVQAEAAAAAQQSQQLAQQVTQDTTAQDAASAAQQIAQQTASAVQSAPSTRAAVEVMAAALTQQQAYAIAAQAATTGRLDALITQQAQTATQLADAVAGLGTVSGLLSQQLTQALEDDARSAVGANDSVAGTATGLVSELRFIATGDQASFDRFFAPWTP